MALLLIALLKIALRLIALLKIALLLIALLAIARATSENYTGGDRHYK